MSEQITQQYNELLKLWLIRSRPHNWSFLILLNSSRTSIPQHEVDQVHYNIELSQQVLCLQGTTHSNLLQHFEVVLQT